MTGKKKLYLELYKDQTQKWPFEMRPITDKKCLDTIARREWALENVIRQWKLLNPDGRVSFRML